MNFDDKLSDTEFQQMLEYIRRYASTELDQWDMWKFDTPHSKVYIDIAKKPSHSDTEDSYTDLTHLIENS